MVYGCRGRYKIFEREVYANLGQLRSTRKKRGGGSSGGGAA